MDPTALSALLRFAPPTYRSHSRSPSCSPSRRQHLATRELDPLLSKLSPTSTLEALQATHAVGTSDDSGRGLLWDSIATVSTSERALGIRAALTGKKLRDWHTEIVNWPWSNSSIDQRNGFLVQPVSSGPSGLHKAGHNLTRMEEGEYWGSLLANKVRQYEERIESIRDDMESLEVEELKDYVRDAHLQLRSRPSSRYGPGDGIPQSSYARLDDFTAVITVTIMQALPYITRLNALLDIWSVRLMVLRQVPEFLQHLEEARIFMEKAWQASGSCDTARKDHIATALPSASFDTMRSLLQSQVHQLGQKLDSMLDALEGREDTIPEEWIDSMENIEAEFASWVIEIENQVLEGQWKNRSSSREAQVEQLESDGPARLHRTSRSSSGLAENSAPFPYYDSSGIRFAMEPQLSKSPINIEPRDEISDKSESDIGRAHIESTKKLTEQITSPEQRDYDAPTTLMVSRLHHELTRDLTNTGPYDILERPSEAINGHGAEPSAETSSAQLLTAPSLSEDQSTRNNLSGGQALLPLDSVTQPALSKSMQNRQSPSLKQSPNRRPTPLVLKKKGSGIGIESNGSSDTSYPSSATTAYYSDMSSPEIYSASLAEYVGSPVEVISPKWHEKGSTAPTVALSRQSSQHTEKGFRTNSDIDQSSKVLTFQRSEASSFTPETNMQASSEAVEDDSASDHEDPVGSGLKRASMTSIEILSRSEVRSIHVRRSGSQSSTSSALSHFRNESGEMEKPLKTSPLRLETKDSGAHITNAQIDGAQPRSLPNNEFQARPVSERPVSPKSLPFKARHRLQDLTDLTAGSTPVNLRRNKSSPTEALKSRSVSDTARPQGSSGSTEDRLDARINSILSTIPVRIRLMSLSKANVLESGSPRDPSISKLDARGSPSLKLTRAQTSYHSPMSARVTPSQASKARSQDADSDIKLYHLHQPGKDAPIKLFVRLVGEAGERVMVRIGGGWADLGEYLKEYAIHHGRRSISDGRFEIQGLSQSNTGSPQMPSGYASGQTTPSSSRPGSSESAFNPSLLVKKGHHFFGTPSTPESFVPRQGEITPGSIEPHEVFKRPISRHGWADDAIPLGLSGPKTKKLEISPGKQMWVDGMVEQARQASTEKKKHKESDVREFGKVGSTKRVFLKLRAED